jgi:hypothetical protein
VPAIGFGRTLGVVFEIDEDHLLRAGSGVDTRRHRRAERGGERQLLILTQVLAAEEQDEVAHQRVVDLVSLLLAEWAAQIDTFDLRADIDRQRVNGDGLVGGHGANVAPQSEILLTNNDDCVAEVLRTRYGG